ncbi:MAG: hypothetical protein A3K67_04475 [Euryarchaeota archaeon RBG_16_62_10]|nr:MAG: hypothetical protein A3K67_04475 [Euryarchaeota archaeon RBG_16_62_10]
MLSGAVLSGGLGTRMGKEKGMMVLGGVPLVRRVADIVAGVTDEVIVSVGPGKSSLYRGVVGDKARIVEDREADIGPLEGMSRAFEAAEGEYVIVSPCDTPFLKQELCRSISSKARGMDGAVPVVRGYLEPLHGAYDRVRCLRAIERAIKEGGRRATEVVETLDIMRIDEEDLRAFDPELSSFENLNSPEAMKEAERRLASDPGHMPQPRRG